jgi:hypothetical protein
MLKLIILTLFAIAVFGQTYPAPDGAFDTNGWVTDCSQVSIYIKYREVCIPPNLKPTGSFKATGCQWFRDPHTGTPMKMITTATARVTSYTTQTAFSKDNTYVMSFASTLGGSGWIYNLDDCSLVRQTAADIGKIVWSSLDDDVLYYHEGSSIKKQIVSTGVTSTVATFDGTGGKPNIATISWGGTGEPSKDDWMAFTDAATEEQLCTINLSSPTSWGCINAATVVETANPSISDWNIADFPFMSKGVDSVSGKRYIWIQGGYGTLFEFTDAAPTPVLTVLTEWNLWTGGDNDGVFDSGERTFDSHHVAIGETADGKQFLMSYELTTDLNSYVSIALFHYGTLAFEEQADSGGLREMTFFHDYDLASVLGCARNSPWCVFSGNPAAYTYGGTTTTIDSSQRVMMLVYNAGEKFIFGGSLLNNVFTDVTDCPFGGACWLYQLPYATLSQDGRYLAWGTNLGEQGSTAALANDTMRIVVADLRRDSKNLRLDEKTTTGGKVRWIAPDSSNCTLTISTNIDLSSPLVNAVTVSGGRHRSYTWATGSTGTTYYVAPTCGTQTSRLKVTLH